jgi:NTE family protein
LKHRLHLLKLVSPWGCPSPNRLAQAEQQLKRAAEITGDSSFLMEQMPRYIAEPLVIAPGDVMPLDWIVDYEVANHYALFEMGQADAERALRSSRLPSETK